MIMSAPDVPTVMPSITETRLESVIFALATVVAPLAVTDFGKPENVRVPFDTVPAVLSSVYSITELPDSLQRKSFPPAPIADTIA